MVSFRFVGNRLSQIRYRYQVSCCLWQESYEEEQKGYEDMGCILVGIRSGYNLLFRRVVSGLVGFGGLGFQVYNSFAMIICIYVTKFLGNELDLG